MFYCFYYWSFTNLSVLQMICADHFVSCCFPTFKQQAQHKYSVYRWVYGNHVTDENVALLSLRCEKKGKAKFWKDLKFSIAYVKVVEYPSKTRTRKIKYNIKEKMCWLRWSYVWRWEWTDVFRFVFAPFTLNGWDRLQPLSQIVDL